MGDRLAERRKAAKRQESMAKLTQKVNMEMAKDLDAVKAKARDEGYEMALIECQRLAWSAGTIGTFRQSIDKLRARRAERKAS